MALEPITRQEQIVAGKKLEPITRMERFLKDYGVSNYFGETTVKGDTLTWDGNTEGLVCVGGAFYKISDATPTENDFANGFSVVVGGEAMEFSKEMVSEMVAMIGTDVLSFDGGFVAYTDGASANDGGFIFPEAGIYFYYEDDSKMTSITIPGYNGFETTTIQTIDEKYLPDSVKGGGTVVVTFSTEDMQNWTCDKTLAEITEAINSGKEVVGSLNGEMKLDFISQTPNASAVFCRVFPDYGTLFSYHIVVLEDKVEVTMAYIEMTKMGG